MNSYIMHTLVVSFSKFCQFMIKLKSYLFNFTATGRVYEYNTRTHERRWVNGSDMGSHFRLRADEK